MALFDPDAWLEIGETAARKPLRTALTALGVFWGTFMLVAMLGVGNGMEMAITRKTRGFATNAVYIWGQSTTQPYKGQAPGRGIGFDNDDVAAVAAEIEDIEHLAPRCQLGGYRAGTQVKRGDRSGAYQIMGDVPAFGLIQPMVFDQGRFVNQRDLDEHRKVAVLGRAVVEELFEPNENPVGQWISVWDTVYQVVGVFHSAQGGGAADRMESVIHIPFSTFQRAFSFGDRVGWITLTAIPEVRASQLEEQVKTLLAERKQVHPQDKMAFGSYNAEEEFLEVKSLFEGVRALIWVVGLATVLSGVVGVSNIMLIVVRERTKEIGVRRALGATPWTVMRTILQESMVLTMVSGYAGLLAGVALLWFLRENLSGHSEVLEHPQVAFEVLLAAMGLVTLTGVVAGLLPAQRAAGIRPVDALRAE